MLCIHLANQMQEGYIGARHFQTGQIRNKSPLVATLNIYIFVKCC